MGGLNLAKKSLTFGIALLLICLTIFPSFNGKGSPNSDGSDDLPNIVWSETYGGAGTALSVKQTSDDGYILSGITGEDATLIKTDKNGSAEWIKHFGGDYGDAAYDAIECSDGGYVCTGGDGYILKDGLTQVFLFKTNENGNELWFKTFRKQDRDGPSFGISLSEVSDGYIVLAILGPYGGTEECAVWLIKIDLIGNELWNKTYGGYSADSGNDVIQTDDNGFLIVGHYTPIYETWADVGLIKTDSSGNLEWIRHYGGTSNDFGVSVAKTDDEGYVVVGIRLSELTSSKGWIIKTDGNGNKLWDEIIGWRPYKIIRSNDNNHVVAGGNSGGAWLFKFEDFENNMPSKPSYVYDKNSFQLKVASIDPDGDRIRY